MCVAARVSPAAVGVRWPRQDLSCTRWHLLCRLLSSFIAAPDVPSLGQRPTIAFSALAHPPGAEEPLLTPRVPPVGSMPRPRGARVLLQLRLPFVLSARLGVQQNRLASRSRRSCLHLFSQGPALLWGQRCWRSDPAAARAGGRAAARCCRAGRDGSSVLGTAAPVT